MTNEKPAEQPKELTKEEFAVKLQAMETDMKEIKEFMNNILKAVDTKEEKPASKKNWMDEFFGLD